MHELVLRDRLHHEHPLLSEVRQHLRDVNVQVVIHAVQENIAEDGDAGAADARRAVHEHGRVAVSAGGHLGGRMVPQGRDLFQELDVLADVAGAAVVGPVCVLHVPDRAAGLGRLVADVQRGGGVGAVARVRGELLGDLKVAQLEGGAGLLGPVWDAAGSFDRGAGVGQHDDEVDVALENHLPEMKDGVGEGSLSSDVESLVGAHRRRDVRGVDVAGLVLFVGCREFDAILIVGKNILKSTCK